MFSPLILAIVLQVRSLPFPSGSYRVGTAVKLYSDASRQDALDLSQPRSIRVQFWYPAKKSQEGTPAPYMSAALLRALKDDTYLNVDAKLLDGWDALKTHSFPLAAPVTRKFPLFIFAPGMGMSSASYTTLAEELASRGIITAIADHPYCGLTIFPDGHLRSYMAVKSKPEEKVRLMATDQSFLLSELEKQPPVHFKIDWRRVSVGGHSIGGAAGLQTGRGDARIASSIDLDGDVWGDVERAGARKPFLVLLNSPGSQVTIPAKMKNERMDEWVGVFAKSPVRASAITVGPAYHLTFSDVPFLLPAELLRASGATLDATRGRNVIADLIQAYIEGGQKRVEAKAKQLPETSIMLRK